MKPLPVYDIKRLRLAMKGVREPPHQIRENAHFQHTFTTGGIVQVASVLGGVPANSLFIDRTLGDGKWTISINGEPFIDIQEADEFHDEVIAQFELKVNGTGSITLRLGTWLEVRE